MRAMFRATLVLALGLLVSSARADEISFSAASPANAPLVTLGRPVPLGAVLDKPVTAGSMADGQLRPAAYTSPAPATSVAQAPPPSTPTLSLPPLSAPAIPTSPAEQYNCGVVTKSPGTDDSFWDKCKGVVTGVPSLVGGRTLFQSDHAFDGFISPVTNPFYFEDPRSLTELRPAVYLPGHTYGQPNFSWRGYRVFGPARAVGADGLFFPGVDETR